MKISRVLKSLALLTVAGAATLRADWMDFSNRCTTGAVKACASLQVFTTLNGSGGTNVVILVANLQGHGWGFDNTGGSALTRIGLVAPNVQGAAGLTVNAAGAQVVGTNPGALWVLSNPGRLGGLIELTAGVNNSGGSTAGGIIGCNSPFGGAQSPYFRTCGAGKWVAFSFTTTNQWSAYNSDVAWLSQAWKVSGQGEECDTQMGGPRPDCVTMTPEPVTMLLLGSGLASVGGVGVIRRRRGKNVTSA